ncbi:MAG: patatin-like phospholipase family protein [Rikenellaceae bacterium]
MRRLLLMILCMIGVASMVAAQSVGVVMNGGGAKGLYHIGVLEALEQQGVPIDYVAGTSMGAIVAGLYAAGYSPCEIHELAVSDEIKTWVTGYIDPNLGYYFRNNRNALMQGKPLLSLRFDPSKGRVLDVEQADDAIPQSLISTTQIDMALNRLFASATVACEGDFEQLMIPFLSVSSDVTRGRDTISMSGDLGLAIRASMSIPLVYSPVVDSMGHLLFDGGVYNNFPIADMQREFAPDFIIGVSCTNDNIQPSASLSLIDQVMVLLVNRRVAEMPQNGMIIERNVDVGMLDFSSAEAVIRLGYDDTIEQLDSLMGYIDQSSLRSAEYYAERRREFNSRKPDLLIGSFNIDGLTSNQETYVRRSMLKRRARSDRGEGGESFEALQRNMYKVLSSGDFVTGYPQISYDDSTRLYDFELQMEHKPSLKLTLGGNISSTPFNQVYAGLNYTSIGGIKQVANAELYLGPIYVTSRIGYSAEFYSRFPLFVDMYYNFANKNLQHGDFGNLTTVDNTRQIKYLDHYLSLGVGTPIMRRSYLQLRTNIGRETFDYDANEYETTDQGTFDKTRFQYVATKVDVESSTLDNLYYPTRGSSLSISGLGILGVEVSYAKNATDTLITNQFAANRSWIGVQVNYAKYFSLTSLDGVSLGMSVDGIYTTIPNMYAQTTRQFIMPAFQPTPHSKMVYMPEYSATSYVAAGLMPSFRLVRDLYLRGEFYAMLRDRYVDPLTIEPSVPDGTQSEFSLKYISQVSLVYNSTIGSMSLAVAKYNLSDWNNTYLTFNFGHTIFSPRGTFD